MQNIKINIKHKHHQTINVENIKQYKHIKKHKT